uniref:RBPJ-interacting and tubulin-associated protein n=1 Tax=Mesocestoides corti TaxID=53468 RepID=A0A5K3EYU2_MESCO
CDLEKTKGKRHFESKRTSLFGSENSDKISEVISSPKCFSKPKNGEISGKSSNYGDWWKPTETSPLEDLRSRDIAFLSKQSSRLNDIAGFSRTSVGRQNSEECGISDKNETLNVNNNSTTEQTQTASSYASGSQNLEPTRPTADNTNQTQKELLERRMSERPPESHTVRPPWFTEEKKSHRSAPNSKTKPGPEQNWGFQRTCNQIDFPTYSAKEMRDARPIVVGSRHEKCSWMPSLAPDFIAEKRNVGRPLSDKLLPSGDSAAGRASTSIVSRNANDVNIPPYPKISAPYAMD